MKEALNWWHKVLTKHGRSNFPPPKNNIEILEYFNNPTDSIWMDYRRY